MERDSIEATVLAQWTTVLGDPPASLDADFFEDCGGDSFGALELVNRLNRTFASSLTVQHLLLRPTIRGIALELRTTTDIADVRLVTLRDEGPGTPLYVVPNTAGNLIGLGRFADPLFQRPVRAFQSKGFGTSESEPSRQMDDVISDLCIQLERSGTPNQMHIAGYCIGGVTAYALASELSARGIDVRSVILLNSTIDTSNDSYDSQFQARLADLARMAGVALPAGAGVEELFESVLASDMDILESNIDEFERRIRVFVGNWHSTSSYEVRPIGLPVRLFATPDRLDPDHGDGDRDWCDIGMPDFKQLDLLPSHGDMLYDIAVLNAVEHELRELD